MQKAHKHLWLTQEPNQCHRYRHHYDHGNSILRLFDVLANFPITTSGKCYIRVALKKKKSRNFIEIKLSTRSSSQHGNSVNTSKNLLKKDIELSPWCAISCALLSKLILGFVLCIMSMIVYPLIRSVIL